MSNFLENSNNFIFSQEEFSRFHLAKNPKNEEFAKEKKRNNLYGRKISLKNEPKICKKIKKHRINTDELHNFAKIENQKHNKTKEKILKKRDQLERVNAIKIEELNFKNQMLKKRLKYLIEEEKNSFINYFTNYR